MLVTIFQGSSITKVQDQNISFLMIISEVQNTEEED